MLHEIEKNRFGCISRNWRASLGRTQSQKRNEPNSTLCFQQKRSEEHTSELQSLPTRRSSDLRNRKKPLWLHLPKLEGEPWTNPKSKTKRTQFDPLFSTKDQNESQIPPGRSTIGRRLNNPRTENKRPTPIGLASFRRGHASSVRTAIPARRISENIPD